MQIIGPGNIPADIKHCLLTVGTFDGLHLGHKHVLQHMHFLSQQMNNIPVGVISFSNHPRAVLMPDQKADFLSTLDEKLNLFNNEHVDFVYLIEFSKEFAGLSALRFVEDHILPFEPKGLVIGRDHFFGNNKEGNVDVLKQFGKQFNFSVQEAPEFVLNEINVSSSIIRKLLNEGNPEEAARLLGYPYFFTGKVVQGQRIGTELGYPTANLIVHDRKLIPSPGVYASKATINNKTYSGMLYIGHRPTFDANELSIEINVFDFQGNLYNQMIRIEPVKHIREDQKFSSREELIKKIKQDEKITKLILGL